MNIIDLAADYEVSDSDVLITIEYGDAQIGSSVVKLASTIKGQGSDIEKLKVGTGSSLQGKKLIVKSVVTDVNNNTNRTSVTYTLQGGNKTQDFHSAGTVDNNGDSIIYRATFNLK